MPDNKDPELPEMLGLRLDPKTRYLAELAARAQGASLTTYVSNAIVESFKRITLRKPTEPEPMYGNNPDDVVIPAVDAEQERVKNEAMLVSNMADIIWSDNPFTRLEIRALTFPHLMTGEDVQLWNYIHAQGDLKIKDGNGYKFNREFIAANWKAIKDKSSKPQRGKK
jgi:hypothetical protein